MIGEEVLDAASFRLVASIFELSYCSTVTNLIYFKADVGGIRCVNFNFLEVDSTFYNGVEDY